MKNVATWLKGWLTAVAIAMPWCCATAGVVVTTRAPLDEAAERAVIVRDLEAIRADGVDLSLRRLLNELIASASTMRADRMTADELLKTMVDSFSLTSAVNNGVVMPLTRRPGEAAFVPTQLLDQTNVTEGMLPVAVVNRFDLAPADFSTCGEVRVIYVKGEDRTFPRFTMIFEGVVPNPAPNADPALASRGCLGLTRFWSSLRGKTGAELGQAVQGLLFTGLPESGIKPIAVAKWFGNPLGQVRVNMFNTVPGGNPELLWQLRQFALKFTTTRGKPLKFEVAPVSDTAWPRLYKEATPGEAQSITDLRNEFQADFLSRRVAELVQLDAGSGAQGGALTDVGLIGGLSTTVPTRFSAMESAPQGAMMPEVSEFPTDVASTLLSNKVGIKLSSMNLPWAVTAEQLLNREGSVTCGGCHQGASFKGIAPDNQGGTVIFPSGGPFVHVSGRGLISEYLRDVALPRRAAILDGFNAAGGQTRMMSSSLTFGSTSKKSSELAWMCKKGCSERDAYAAKGRAFSVGGAH